MTHQIDESQLGELLLNDGLRVPAEFSDFHYACGDAVIVPFNSRTDVKHLHACIPGHNDENDWFWVVELKDGRFGLLQAWCDNTGWGCQSGGEWFAANGPEDAVEKVLLLGGYNQEQAIKRRIKEQLLNQLSGKQPYGLEVVA